MNLPVVEIYSDIHCPWAYLANYRLRQVWSQYKGRLSLKWRSLSLEYVNHQSTPKNILDLETELMQTTVEPALPIKHWPHPDWQWPVTFWPAFEALACAQAQGEDQAFAMSWALRHAFFEGGGNLSMRYQLFKVAQEVAQEVPLDLSQFEDDWDSGRYKSSVLTDSERGWHTLKVKNSPTFVLPNGRQFSNPGVGEFKLDLAGKTSHYTPVNTDPLKVYQAMLDEAVS